MQKRLFSEFDHNEFLSIVLLICGVALLFTSKYRLSIFFITTLVIFRLILEAYKQGVTKLNVNIAKGSFSAELKEKEKIKEKLTKEVLSYTPQNLSVKASENIKVKEKVKAEQKTLADQIQESIDTAFALGYRSASSYSTEVKKEDY